ncbi:MAG: hypothetical protein NVS3B16_11080 [Vulcanimicrobiaceae bacterium]
MARADERNRSNAGSAPSIVSRTAWSEGIEPGQVRIAAYFNAETHLLPKLSNGRLQRSVREATVQELPSRAYKVCPRRATGTPNARYGRPIAAVSERAV